MCSKLVLKYLMLCSSLFMTSTSFAMDETDPLYEAKMAFMRSLEEDPNYKPFLTFNHDPDRIRLEKEKYNFMPLQWEDIPISTDNKPIHVPTGQFHWVQPESPTAIYTEGLYDCVGVLLVGPRIGLGHIPYSNDYAILKENLVTITNPEEYRITFVSHYYSDNLKKINEIIKEKFPTSPLYADISDNTLDYGAGADKTPTKYYYSVGKNMQAQNQSPRRVCIDGRTGNISKELPK